MDQPPAAGDLIEFVGAKALRDRHRRDAPAAITAGQWEDMLAQAEKLAGLLQRCATASAGLAKQQAEMRADLIASGAFERKSSILLPGDFN